MPLGLQGEGGRQRPGRREALCPVAIPIGGADRCAAGVAGETVEPEASPLRIWRSGNPW